MKFRSALLSATLLFAPLADRPSHAAGPDDLYLQAYSLIQEADEYDNSGRIDQARLRYQDAEKNLSKLQKSYPAYNTKAVGIRMEYVREKLGEPVKAGSTNAPSHAASTNTIPKSSSSSPNSSEAQSAPVQQPAPASAPAKSSPPPANRPVGAKADANDDQKLALLQADNQMLQAKLQEALSARPAAIDPGELAKAEERIKDLEKQKELLRASLSQTEAKQPQAADAAMLQQARNELEDTKKKLTQSVATIATLTQEKQTLQTQLESAKAKPAEPEKVADGKSESSRIKDLEKERDSLLKKLNDANKELYDVKARGQLAQFESLTNQLANLRARVEVFEARKVPYTPEELALLDKNVANLDSSVDPNAGKKSIRELPAAAADLVRKAERAFASHNYAEAEANYKEVVKLDENNPASLANLAAIQLEMDKLPDAEANLKKALAASPDDAYALSLLGMLRFRQEKYDDALTILSRAAQLDPKNAETQNYLGITLSQEGQRDAAETALRKAILLQPNYGGAHHNLAVVYAHQKPPAIALAKFHYNKAIALGQPPNPDLEKILNGNSAK
jgi:tetratricopeptide (TPR) repeat protein